MLRLLNFKMVFQLVLRKLFKSELFLCLLKVDHVIKLRKEPTGAKSFKNNPTLIKKRKKLNASLMGRFSNFLKAFYLSLQQIIMRLPP